MLKPKRLFNTLAVFAVVLSAVAVVYANISREATVSSGSVSVGKSFVNVGQPAIGRTGDANLTMHVGVVPIHARTARTPISGDCTGNRLVNLTDFSRFRDCFRGVGFALGINCGCADLDRDRDIDMRDAQLFLRHFGVTGP